MSALYEILPLGGDLETGPVSGAIGSLAILPISKLRVDDTYQRAISVGSVRNIKAIIKAFDWAKFLPVIVVLDGDHYSVIDGQHRTIAALTLGIEAVPCYVLSCGPREAAAAFAAINGNVTPVGPIDLWFAQLAAGDRKCAHLARVLEAASVTVTRRKDAHKVGETRSINVLIRALDFYGPEVLRTILQCITECGDGNPGMIVGAVIHGIGRAIRTKPELLSEPSKLFDVFDDLVIADMLQEARIESARTGNIVQAILTRQFNAAISAATKGRAHAA